MSTQAEQNSTLLDALDLLSCARDMAALISECDHKPAGSTAYVIGEKLEEAEKLIQSLVEGKA